MDPWLIVFGFGVGVPVGTTGMGGGGGFLHLRKGTVRR